MDPRDVIINGEEQTIQAQPTGFPGFNTTEDRAAVNIQRSQQLWDVSIQSKPALETPVTYYALKVAGKIATPPTPNMFELENRKMQLDESVRETAVIVTVDSSGNELLLG